VGLRANPIARAGTRQNFPDTSAGIYSLHFANALRALRTIVPLAGPRLNFNVDGRPQQSAQALNTELGNKDQELACHPDGLNGLPILLVREACRSEEEMMGTTTSKREGKSLLAPGLWVLAAVGLTTSPVLGQSSARQPQNVILSEAKDLLFFPTWSHDPGLVRNKQSAFSLVLGASRKPASATFLNPLRATNINDRTWRMPTSFSGMAERFTMISGKGPWSSILGGSTGPSFPLNRGGWSDRAASLLSGRSASVATGPLTFTCPSGGTCWVGGASGNWSNASNWSNGVPNSTTSAVIDNGTAAVTLDIGGAQVNNLTVDSDDSLSFSNGASLGVNGTSIYNAGKITLNSTGSNTDLVLAGGITHTLSGGGTLTLGNNGTNRIYGSGYNATLNNQETIQGAGRIAKTVRSPSTTPAQSTLTSVAAP